MTEEEAKTKRCCGSDTCGVCSTTEKIEMQNGSVVHVALRMCIGSACMAWRVTPQSTEIKENGRVQTTIAPTGYCGLAGKP